VGDRIDKDQIGGQLPVEEQILESAGADPTVASNTGDPMPGFAAICLPASSTAWMNRFR
jgi:hypothetical protein